PIWMRRGREEGKRIKRLARRIFICSTGTSDWRIAANWTIAGREAAFRSVAKTCGRRLMPFWPGNPFRPTKSRASVAISSGSRAMNRIIFDDHGTMRCCVGIEIGGTKLQLALGDEAGKIRERRKLSVERARGAAGIRQQIEQILPGLMSKDKPA